MSVLSTGRARWLVVGATLALCGCATNQTSRISQRGGCPMSFTLSCEVSRPGGISTAENCRCVRHRDINVLLRGQ